MNEYTYKAKKLDNGEWTTGSLFAGLSKHLILNSINTKDMIVTGSEVDKATICRYAGNGFWEHDIIRFEKEVGVIRFGADGTWRGFYVEWLTHDAKNYSKGIGHWIESDEVNVIGNEIDNPVEELLKCLEEKE